jgi:crossover junction endodeoxyribonuclease RuvC
MRIVGIDYSLSSPCVCVSESDRFGFSSCRFYYLTSREKFDRDVGNIQGDLFDEYNSNEQRYFNITDWVLTKLREGDIVYLEGYSLGSTGMVFNIAENAGLLKHYLWKENYEYHVVPPTVIKKFATGKGNANKEKLQEHFIEETGVDVKKMLDMTEKQWNPSSDIIDAYYICKYGHHQENENEHLAND